MTNPSSEPSQYGRVRVTPVSKDHCSKNQRWVLHYSQGEESGIFKVSSALDGRWLGTHSSLLPINSEASAAEVKITFLGNGRGYDLQYVDTPSYRLGVNDGHSSILNTNHMGTAMQQGFKVYSVSYHD
jgi:phospholipase C